MKLSSLFNWPKRLVLIAVNHNYSQHQKIAVSDTLKEYLDAKYGKKGIRNVTVSKSLNQRVIF